jgi:hypothetical protein
LKIRNLSPNDKVTNPPKALVKVAKNPRGVRVKRRIRNLRRKVTNIITIQPTQTIVERTMILKKLMISI